MTGTPLYACAANLSHAAIANAYGDRYRNGLPVLDHYLLGR